MRLTLIANIFVAKKKPFAGVIFRQGVFDLPSEVVTFVGE